MARATSPAVALATTLLLSAAPHASATNRYYQDAEATSPNGAYHATTVSPDNANRQAFADDFVYTFRDVATDTVLWTRRQPREESSPVALWISDSGWLVARTAHDELFAFEPLTGAKACELRIVDAFSKEDEAHISWTTAGPMWSSYSNWYFLNHEDKEYFVLRTSWGTRIALSLTDRRKTEITPGLLKAAERAEVAKAVRELENAEPKPGEWESLYSIANAALLAGSAGAKEALPALHRIACAPVVAPEKDRPPLRGRLDPGSVEQLPVRAFVHTAIRMLGAVPPACPCTDSGLKLPPLKGPRHDHADSITRGLTSSAVLVAIGEPDQVIWFADRWEYDMDAGEPFTLVLTFDDDARVSSVDRVPPRWRTGERFDLLADW